MCVHPIGAGAARLDFFEAHLDARSSPASAGRWVILRTDGDGGRRSRGGTARIPYPDALLHVAALSAVAGAIHAVVAVPHFEEAPARGAFFASLAAFQLGWTALIYVRPSEPGFRLGAAVSVAVLAVWVVSRTVGVPVGPGVWQPERVGALDVAASAAEALIAVLAVAFLRTRAWEESPPVLRVRSRLAKPLGLAVMFSGLLSLFVAGGHHH